MFHRPGSVIMAFFSFATFINFRKQNKMAGFALKQLEKNFPKQAKQLKDFYNWSMNPDDEFNLLKNIMKSM